MGKSGSSRAGPAGAALPGPAEPLRGSPREILPPETWSSFSLSPWQWGQFSGPCRKLVAGATSGEIYLLWEVKRAKHCAGRCWSSWAACSLLQSCTVLQLSSPCHPCVSPLSLPMPQGKLEKPLAVSWHSLGLRSRARGFGVGLVLDASVLWAQWWCFCCVCFIGWEESCCGTGNR